MAYLARVLWVLKHPFYWDNLLLSPLLSTHNFGTFYYCQHPQFKSPKYAPGVTKRLGSHKVFTFDKSPSINQMRLQNCFVSALCALSRNVLSFATLSESTLVILMHFLTSMKSMNYLLFPTTGDCGISYFEVAYKFMSINTISRDFLIHTINPIS